MQPHWRAGGAAIQRRDARSRFRDGRSSCPDPGSCVPSVRQTAPFTCGAERTQDEVSEHAALGAARTRIIRHHAPRP